MLQVSDNPQNGLFDKAYRLILSDNFCVLLSQAFVSGTNFLTAMIVGDACGADGLGFYALGFSILVFANGFQSALISIPYTVFYLATKEQERHIRASNSIINHVLLILAMTGLLILASVVLYFLKLPGEASIAFALTATVPFFITREFLRRIHFTESRYRSALRVDFITAMCQIGLLAALWASEVLTAVMALICIGVSCAVSCFGFVRSKIKTRVLNRKKFRETIGRDWQFSKWLLVEQLFTVASAYAMPWWIAFYLDSKSVGVFAACFAIAGLSNPFLQAIGSYSLPTFAKLVAEKNAVRLKMEIRRISLMTVALMTTFFLICLLFGGFLLELFFSNPDFVGHGLIVGLLSARAVLGSFGLTAHYYLLAIEKPKISLIASVAAVASMLLAATVLIPQMGLMGAALAWLAGTFVESLIMLIGHFSYRQFVRSGVVSHA